MPVTVSIPYSTYAEQLLQGTLGLLLSKIYCPQCRGKRKDDPRRPLKLTTSTVERNAAFLEEDENSCYWVIWVVVRIALARCPVCGHRPRILPSDLLPYKRYTPSVIDYAASLYKDGELSLRRVVWEHFHGDRAVAHTTLHAWTEGMGAYAQGYPAGELPWALRSSTVLTEVEKRHRSVKEARSETQPVDPRRYRSEPRKERLSQCARLLACAAAFAISVACFLKDPARSSSRLVRPLTALNQFIAGVDKTYGLGFPTGNRYTQPEHRVRSWMKECLRKGAQRCSTGGRSPPSDTNRSHHS